MADEFNVIANFIVRWQEENKVILDQIKNSVKGAGKGLKEFGDIGENIKNVTVQGMQQTRDAIVNTSTTWRKTSKGWVDSSNVMIKQGRRFRMEYLSVMFIGMSIKKTFEGIITPVLQTVGVFEIFRAVMLAVLLPVLMPFIQAFLNLSVWLLKSPKWFRDLIAVAVLLGFALGTLLMIMGTLSIVSIPTLLGAIAQGVGAMSGAGAAATTSAAGFSLFGLSLGAIAVIAAVVLYVIAGLAMWWKELTAAYNTLLGPALAELGKAFGDLGKKLGLNIDAWGLLKIITTPVYWFFLGLIGIITGVVKVITWLVNAISTLIDWFKELWKWAEPLRDLVGGIGGVLGGVGKAIGGALGFQEGGIITRPTLGLLGEHGAEAVIPLSKGGMGSSISIGNINLNTVLTPYNVDLVVKELIEKISSEIGRVSMGRMVM